MTDKTVKSIICDGCDTELVIGNSFPGSYGLELRHRNFRFDTPGMVYAIGLDLDENKHFCKIKCLKKWLEVEAKSAEK